MRRRLCAFGTEREHRVYIYSVGTREAATNAVNEKLGAETIKKCSAGDFLVEPTEQVLDRYMLDIDTDHCSEAYWLESWNARREKKRQDNPQGVIFDGTDHGRIKAQSVVNVEPKQAKHIEADQLTAAFLANGGTITLCKPDRYRKFRFGGARPIAGMTGRRDGLSKPQWYDPIPPAGEVRDLIRRAQMGDERAKNRLLKSYHRKILKHLTEAAYYGPGPDELMATAVDGFSYALTNFNLQRNNEFWAYAEQCIGGRILDFIKEWNRNGIAGIDTRATPTEAANGNRKIGCSLNTNRKNGRNGAH